MIKEGKFGVQEAVALITITIVSKAFYTSPTAVVQLAGTTGWYLTLISTAAGAVGFTFILLLLKEYPKSNLPEIYEKVLGKFWGSIFLFLLAASLMFSAISNLREFSDVLESYALPQSPPSFLLLHVIIGTVIAAFLGLESQARLSRLISYILLTGILIVLLLSIKNYNISYLFPILGYGIGRTAVQGLQRASVYGEIILLGIFAQSLQGVKNIKRAGYTSLIISGVFVSLMLLSYSLTFPYTIGRELTAPMYTMTSLIEYGRFFQRLEPIFLFTWYFSSFIGISILFYASLSVYCHLFGIADKRPIILPMSIILFALAMLPSSVSTITYGLVPATRQFSWIIYLGFPSLVYCISKLVKKKGAQRNA